MTDETAEAGLDALPPAQVEDADGLDPALLTGEPVEDDLGDSDEGT